MKLDMSLPDRPGLIYTMPVLDILVLVLIFPLLGSSFSTNAGVELTLHPTDHRFPLPQRYIIVTVKGAEKREIFVNRKLVEEKDLMDELAEQAKNWKGGGQVGIIYRVDVQVPSGYKERITKMLLAGDYQVFNAGSPASK